MEVIAIRKSAIVDLSLAADSPMEEYSLAYRVLVFIVQLGKKAVDDDLFALSNELAYKILLSFFPFLVFLVSLLGFLNLNDSQLVTRMVEALPMDAGVVVANFISELQAQPSKGLLSFSLLVSIYSASNGFRAVIRGVNKAHGFKDERSFIKKTILCAGLMMIFAFAIVTMLGLWIFSDALIAMVQRLIPFGTGGDLFLIKFIPSVISFAVLLVVTAWMYRLACARYGAGIITSSTNEKTEIEKPETKKSQKGRGYIFPGAFATVALWAISSSIFGIFISRFSNISVIYGSIAGIFILIIWLNLITFFLLLGNSVNALLWDNT